MIIRGHDCQYVGFVPGEYTVPDYRVFKCNNCGDQFAIFNDGSSMEHDRNLRDISCEERKKLKMIKDIIE